MLRRRQSTSTGRRAESPRPRQRQSGATNSSRSPVFSYYAGGRPYQSVNRPGTTQPASTPPSTSKQSAGSGRLSKALRLVLGRMRLRQVPSYVSVAAIVLGLIWTLTLSSSPRIVIEEADGTSSQRDTQHYLSTVHDLWAGPWRNKSKLTFDAAATEQEIQTAFPELADIRVQIPLLGRRPTIVLQPATAVLRLESGGDTFYVDANGKVLLDSSAAATDAALLLVRDETGVPLTPGSQAMPAEHIQFLVQLAAQLRAQGVQSVGLILSGQAANQISMTTTDHPYYVKFQLGNPNTVRRAVGSYLAVREHSRPGEYIDVRIPGKVFYR